MEKRINIYLYCFFLLLNGSILFAQNEKCGTFTNPRNIIKFKFQNMDQKKSSRISMHMSVLTESGRFRIHYDTTGTREPAMVTTTGTRIPNSYQQYIDTLKKILDYVWKTEIEQFGFIPPPADNNNGGGNEYDFYIIENGISGLYGETISDEIFNTGNGNALFSTYIEIDNDFDANYETQGIDGMKATCAHEFHHAIQLGGSGLWDSEEYFYELCAQALEQMVFPEVKDYIIQMRKYFNNSSTIDLFNRQNSGYERGIWGIFLVDKYGHGIMKAIWDEMKYFRPVKASQNALNGYSTSLEREFADFAFWNFYTGYRADTAKYYKDAISFPMVAMNLPVFVSSVKQDVSFMAKSFTANYIKAVTNTDSAFVIVANTNFSDALSYAQQAFPFQLSFTSSSASGLPAISHSIFAKFQVTDYSNWSYNAIGAARGPVCFPNPFNPKSSSLLISLHGIQSENYSTVSIFSAGTMDLVYSGQPTFKFFSGTQYAEWNGRDNNGNIAASGVYIFVLTNGVIFNKGKFAIIR